MEHAAVSHLLEKRCVAYIQEEVPPILLFLHVNVQPPVGRSAIVDVVQRRRALSIERSENQLVGEQLLHWVLLMRAHDIAQ